MNINVNIFQFHISSRWGEQMFSYDFVYDMFEIDIRISFPYHWFMEVYDTHIFVQDSRGRGTNSEFITVHH